MGRPALVTRTGTASSLRSVLSLLCSVALLLAGNGLLGLLVVVRSHAAGFGPAVTGWVMSAYFIGFFAGTFTATPLIRRVGHIRAFAIFATVAAVSALSYPIWQHPFAWIGLRVVTGMAMVGVCTAIESWLNASDDPLQRSRLFSAYMMVSLLALSAGQLLINSQPVGSFILFSTSAILLALAVLPVASTRLPQPVLTRVPRVQLLSTARIAPAAALGALLAGLVLGGFWGMGPAFASAIGLSRAQVSVFMSLAILGGASMQVPIGRLSDRYDRRSALAIASGLAALLAAAAAVLPTPGLPLFALGLFAFGGLAFALYPLCVAHLLDHLPTSSALPGCSALLLFNGIGAACGPVLSGGLMQRFGAQALPAGFAFVLLLLALFSGGRLLLRVRARLHPVRFHPMLRTTPVALSLLPGTDDARQNGNRRGIAQTDTAQNSRFSGSPTRRKSPKV
jgi:MFS family permease